VRRFFVEEIHATDGRLTIPGREARHITRVLRMGPGDRFILLDRKGARFQVCIESVNQGNVAILLERPLPAPPSSPVSIAIGQAVLKSGAMELMIQKTTELGVRSICPFISERTIVRPEADKMAHRMRRWQDIAIAASKQSDRARPPEIMPVAPFPELLRSLVHTQALKLILWEAEESNTLKSVLRPFGSRSPTVLALVGPEGGFTRGEISLSAEAGFISVSLGPQTLRAETAAVAVAAALQYEFADSEREETAHA
jgi:16S rRNA (uracil1498-N3)-methyltransferase